MTKLTLIIITQFLQFAGILLIFLSGLEIVVIPIPKIGTTYSLLLKFSFISLILTGFLIFIEEKKSAIRNPIIITLVLYLFSSSMSASISDIPQATLFSLKNLFLAVSNYFTFAFLAKLNPLFVPRLIKAITIFNILISALSILVFISPPAGVSIWRRLLLEDASIFFTYYLTRSRILPIGALILTSFVPLAIFLQEKKQTIFRWFSFVSILAGAVSITLSNYRSNLVAIVAGIIALFVIFRLKSLATRAISIYMLMFAMVVLLIQSSTVYKNLDRFTGKNPEDKSAIITRFFYYREALALFARHPLFGIGPGTYPYYVDPIQLSIVPSITVNQGDRSFWATIDSPHNIFLLMLSETGILGFSSFILWLILLIKSDYKTFNHTSSFNVTKAVLSVTFWIFIINNAFDVSSPTTLVFALSIRGLSDGMSLSRSIIKKSNHSFYR